MFCFDDAQHVGNTTTNNNDNDDDHSNDNTNNDTTATTTITTNNNNNDNNNNDDNHDNDNNDNISRGRGPLEDSPNHCGVQCITNTWRSPNLPPVCEKLRYYSLNHIKRNKHVPHRVRLISLLTLSLLTLLESEFPGNSLSAWEFHSFKLRLCLSQALENPQF